MIDPDGLWSAERRLLTAGLTSTISLVAVEALAIATVMPKVSDDLDGLGLYGWVFSAFFLGTMVGIVAAGQSADRVGATPAFTAGLLLFAGGLLAGGLAPSMAVLVLARAAQGVGAGAVPAIGYFCIGRSYPEHLRPRMFAVLSTAWVVPGLVGPSLAGVVEHAVGWRWVFLGLIPLVALSGGFTLRAVRPVGPGTAGDGGEPSRLPAALRLATGAALVLAGLDGLGGLDTRSLLLGAALVVAGGVVAWPAYLRLVPPGTLRAKAGMPAAILASSTLTFSFFGTDAYVPLALADVRGLSTAWIGVSVTLTTLAWTAASWVQQRVVEQVGARRLVMLGHLVVVAGVAVTAAVLVDGLPVAVGFVGWTVGGFGIGLGYAPISVTVLGEAEPGREGAAVSALQLTEQMGIALGVGIGGAWVAIGDGRGWHPSSGIAVAWALAAAVGVAGSAVARRLPGPGSRV